MCLTNKSKFVLSRLVKNQANYNFHYPFKLLDSFGERYWTIVEHKEEY